MAVQSTTSVTIDVNQEIQRKAQEIFLNLGMDMTSAINVFLRQAVYCNGFPFDVRLNMPNAVTLAALDEGDRMIFDPSAKAFDNLDDLFEDLHQTGG